MKFRHEWKHQIAYADLITLRARLSAIMQPDPFATDGRYFIRSLYFDTPGDKALREKIEGVNKREKFRIRYYNHDTSLIHLEKKSKLNGLCHKQKARISAGDAQKIVDGDIAWLATAAHPLLVELYSKMRSQGLAPKTLVDYVREPFIFPAGNVRVTLDYDIRTGLTCTDLLNPSAPTVSVTSAAAGPIILEVKWDEFLPDIIRAAVQLPNCRTAPYSKYAACRIYG